MKKILLVGLVLSGSCTSVFANPTYDVLWSYGMGPSRDKVVSFSPDGTRILVRKKTTKYALGPTGPLAILDATTGKVVSYIDTGETVAEDSSFTSDSKLLITGPSSYLDGNPKLKSMDVYDVESGDLVRSFPLKNPPRFSAMDQRFLRINDEALVVVSDSVRSSDLKQTRSTISFWNFQTGELLGEAQIVAKDHCLTASVSADGKVVGVAEGDGTTYFYSTETYKSVFKFEQKDVPGASEFGFYGNGGKFAVYHHELGVVDFYLAGGTTPHNSVKVHSITRVFTLGHSLYTADPNYLVAKSSGMANDKYESSLTVLDSLTGAEVGKISGEYLFDVTRDGFLLTSVSRLETESEFRMRVRDLNAGGKIIVDQKIEPFAPDMSSIRVARYDHQRGILFIYDDEQSVQSRPFLLQAIRLNR